MTTIQIGKFLIQRMAKGKGDGSNGKLWISTLAGEGMAVNEDRFEKVIFKFYEENF